MFFYVYVLKHNASDQTYIGYTTNLQQRLAEHNNRGTKFTTRNKGSWHIAYAEAYASQEDAREREAMLKQHGGSKRQLLKRIQKSLSPKLGLDAAKDSQPTVYQKHSSLRTRKRMYRG